MLSIQICPYRMSSYGSDAEFTAKKNLCRIEKDEYGNGSFGDKDKTGRTWTELEGRSGVIPTLRNILLWHDPSCVIAVYSDNVIGCFDTKIQQFLRDFKSSGFVEVYTWL